MAPESAVSLILGRLRGEGWVSKARNCPIMSCLWLGFVSGWPRGLCTCLRVVRLAHP